MIILEVALVNPGASGCPKGPREPARCTSWWDRARQCYPPVEHKAATGSASDFQFRHENCQWPPGHQLQSEKKKEGHYSTMKEVPNWSPAEEPLMQQLMHEQEASSN